MLCLWNWLAKYSQSHFNWNKYTEAIKQKEANAKKAQKDLDLEIKKYERYDFYYPRYMSYKTSIEACQTSFRDTLNEKVNLLVAMQNLQLL